MFFSRSFLKNKSNNFIYSLYYLIGGIYTSHRFSDRIKYIWFGSCTLIILLHIVIAVGYFFTTKFDVMGAVWVFGTAYASILVLTIVPFLTYRYRAVFDKIFKFIENHHSTSAYQHEAAAVSLSCIAWINPVKEIVFWLTFLFFVIELYSATIVLDILFVCKREAPFRDVQHHLTGLPYIDHIPTLGHFWALFFFENIIFQFPVTIIICEVILIIAIATELNNIVVDYCLRLQFFTRLVNTEIEEDNRKHQNLIDTFRENFIIFIREYVKLLR